MQPVNSSALEYIVEHCVAAALLLLLLQQQNK